MARIPDKENLGARPIPQSNRGIVSYNPTILNNATKNIGTQVTRVGASLGEVEDTLNTARAEAVFTRAQIEAENGFDGDDDYGTYEPRYKEKMEKALAETLPMLKGNDAELFKIKAQNKILEGQYKIKDLAATQQYKSGITTTIKSADANKQAAVLSKDPRVIQALGNNITEQLSTMYDNPKADQMELYKLERSLKKDYYESVAASLTPQEYQAMRKPKFGGEVGNDIAKLGKYGSEYTKGQLSPKFVASLIEAESGGDGSATNDFGTAAGLYGFTKGTAKARGLNYERLKVDPKYATEAALDYAMDNKKTLEKALNRPVSEKELLLAHMGGGNAIALLKPENANKLAIDVLPAQRGKTPSQVVLENGGTLDMTAKEFADKRMNKYSGDGTYTRAFNWTDNLDPKFRAKLDATTGKIVEKETLMANTQAEVDNIIDTFGDDVQAGSNYAKSISDPILRDEVEKKLVSEYTKMKAFDKKAYEERVSKAVEFVSKGERFEDIDPAILVGLEQKDANALLKYQAKQDVRSLAPALDAGPVQGGSLIQPDMVQEAMRKAGYRSFEQMAYKDQGYYNNLMSDYTANPYSITKKSVPELMANVPQNKLQEVLKYRQAVMAGETLPAADATGRASVVKYAKESLGLDDEELAKFTLSFDSRVAQEQAAKGKKLTIDEMDKIRDKLSIEVAFNSGSDKNVYAIDGLDTDERNLIEVPMDKRSKIIEAIQEQTGDQVVSEEQIRATYLNYLGL